MRANVSEVKCHLPDDTLDGADWADTYQVVVTTPFENARMASLAAFDRFPPWVDGLMMARNMIVKPLGLKTEANKRESREVIGFFPLLDEAPDKIVVGMNDRHLDFRCVVDLNETEEGQRVTISTLIKRHNMFGRIYLATIMPFHKLILRSTLARIAAA